MNGQSVNSLFFFQILSLFLNAFPFPFIYFSGSPVEEDGHKEVKGTKWRGGKGKQRHKFTMDELYILNQTFEETPYPDFTTRKELAKQLRCQVYIIDVNEIFKALHSYIFY